MPKNTPCLYECRQQYSSAKETKHTNVFNARKKIKNFCHF